MLSECEVQAAFLGDYFRYLQTDGYTGDNKVENALRKSMLGQVLEYIKVAKTIFFAFSSISYFISSYLEDSKLALSYLYQTKQQNIDDFV